MVQCFTLLHITSLLINVILYLLKYTYKNMYIVIQDIKTPECHR